MTKKIKTNYLFVGLGNPGPEYEKSRHSVGRMIVLDFEKKLPSKGLESKNKYRLLTPDDFMNNSGKSVKKLIKTKAEAHDVVVIHDDLDLPLGQIKISYNRGSGGHKGVESVAQALKTREFVRLRVGIAPTTPSGKIKKPNSEKVVDFVIANFKPSEQDELKKIIKKAKEIMASLVDNGLEKTMNLNN